MVAGEVILELGGTASTFIELVFVAL